jgi:DNA-directed RNA polymerase alpha subunit
MLECLEFRAEKNSLGGEFQQYGKFSFSRLEKGQGLTVANTLRRVLLYELPAVGITSVLIRTSNRTSEASENKNFEKESASGYNSDSSSITSAEQKLLGFESVKNLENTNNEKKLSLENRTDISSQNGFFTGANLSTEISGLSEVASSHHEFSTLPGVKESVLEILFNLKSVVFENIFSYSSIQKGTLALRVDNFESTKDLDVSLSAVSSTSPGVDKVHPLRGFSKAETLKDYKIRASQLILPSEIRLIHPNQILATLTKPETTFELEFTIEKITQSDLTSTSSFSGRAPNRSTRNRRILPIDGTIFPVKKVNYTIEQDSFGKEIVFFEVWTNGGLHPRDAIFQSIEKVIKLFQTFQE